MALADKSAAGPMRPIVDGAAGTAAQTRGKLHELVATWPRRVAAFLAVTVAGALIVQFVPNVHDVVLPSGGGFHGTILRALQGPPDVTMREQPNNGSVEEGTLAPGTGVVIVCTAQGEPVTGPGHGTRPVISRLWDKVRVDGSSDLPEFVPDALVNTGTTRPEGPTC